MKIVHLSDVHVGPAEILGCDPEQRLRDVLAHIAEFHADADRLVVTGDLVHHGSEDSYRRFRVMLENAGFAIAGSGELSPRLLIGNHDERESFRRIFPEVMADPEGFIQYIDPTPAGLFVYLDTNEPGTHAGHLCDRRLLWLNTVLKRAHALAQPVWLFMHHNPLNVGVASSDTIGLKEPERFQSLVREYREVIRHIFFGHCHFTLSGSFAGVPYSAPRSSNHPCWPEFSGDARLMAFGPLEPSYNVCLIQGESVVVHTIDYQRQSEIQYLETDDTGWVEDGTTASYEALPH